MILTLIISFIVALLNGIFFFLPEATIASLPLIGEVVSNTLTLAMRLWNSFMETVPYAETLWQVFIVVILPFEVLLLVAKFFLGHRLPAHLN